MQDTLYKEINIKEKFKEKNSSYKPNLWETFNFPQISRFQEALL